MMKKAFRKNFLSLESSHIYKKKFPGIRARPLECLSKNGKATVTKGDPLIGVKEMGSLLRWKWSVQVRSFPAPRDESLVFVSSSIEDAASAPGVISVTRTWDLTATELPASIGGMSK